MGGRLFGVQTGGPNKRRSLQKAAFLYNRRPLIWPPYLHTKHAAVCLGYRACQVSATISHGTLPLLIRNGFTVYFTYDDHSLTGRDQRVITLTICNSVSVRVRQLTSVK